MAYPMRRTAGMGVLLLLFWTMAMVLGVPAGATHVAPVLVEGNPDCGDLGDWDNELRIEPVEDGVYDGITVDVRDTEDGQVFDWSSTHLIDAVFAKGGNEGNLYSYSPAASSDTGLHAPVNPSGGYAGLSHISFCWNNETTTTTQPTTTTTQPTTTTTQPTTTTTQPTTTTTTPDQPVTVILKVEACMYKNGQSASHVVVKIVPAGGATVTVFDSNGDVIWIVTGGGSSTVLLAGDYTWEAVAEEGYVLEGEGSGGFTVEDCTPPSTTTTTEPTTTTTTQPTTTTTYPTTTTTTQATTTTVGAEVLGVQVESTTTTAAAAPATLPFTGVSSGALAGLAVSVMAAGLLLVAAARRSDEELAGKSWS